MSSMRLGIADVRVASRQAGKVRSGHVMSGSSILYIKDESEDAEWVPESIECLYVLYDSSVYTALYKSAMNILSEFLLTSQRALYSLLSTLYTSFNKYYMHHVKGTYSTVEYL